MPSILRFGSIRLCLSLLAISVLLLTACTPAQTGTGTVASAVPVTGNNNPPTNTQSAAGAIPEAVVPAVKIADQAISGGTVTVDNVTSPGPGWIVIHINSNGAPGEIIGWSPVKAGVNQQVQITVDATKATSVLYAMLHVDAGTVGTYEFPGPDKPLTVNGQMVNPAFAVTGGAGGSGAAAPVATNAAPQAGAAAATATTGSATTAPTAQQAAAPTATTAGGYSYGTQATATQPAAGGAAAASGPATVSVNNNAKLGNILVDSKGITLYIFKKDSPGTTACTGGCLENWPALLVTSGDPTAGENVTGKLGTIARPDSGTQVTYNDMPLYYFAGDQAPGDVNGQGIGGAWFAATP